MNRSVVPDIGVAEQAPASSSVARAALFLFSLSIPLDVVALFGTTSSIAYFAGMLLAIGAAWQVASTGLLRPITWSIAMLTGYTAWALASVLWSHDTDEALHRFTVNVMLLAAIWMCWQIANSRRALRLMAVGYVIGCGIVAVGTWQSFLAGVGYSDYQERYSAMGYDPNDMGVSLSLAMPLAAYLAMTGKGRRPYLWLAYLPLGLSAIALSGSRGATLTVAVAVLGVAFWISRRSRFATVLMVVLLAAVVLVVAARTPETLQRVFTLREQIAGGGNYGLRRTIWRAALHVFARHPFAGIGTGQFPTAVAPELGFEIEAHNAFVSVAVELGIVGLALFAGAFAAVLQGVWKKTGHERVLVLTLLATWLVGVSSLTWELRKATWFVVLVGAVVSRLVPDDEPELRP